MTSKKGKKKMLASGEKIRSTDWSPRMDEVFVSLMMQENVDEYFNNNVFNPEAWKRMTTKFNDQFGERMSIEHLKNHLKVMKRNFDLYKALANKTGWVWDADKHVPVPPDETMWEEVIAGNKDYNKVKNKPFPHYNDFTFLFAKNIATGKGACTSTNLVNLDEQDSSDNDIIDMTLTNEDYNGVAARDNLKSRNGTENDDTPSPMKQSLSTSLGMTSTGKRTWSGPTPITSKKKKVSNEVDSVAYKRAMKKLQLMEVMLEREKKKAATIYSADDCWSKLEERCPNLNPQVRLAIAEAFKDERELWTFMRCDDQMLEGWIARQVAEYYRVPFPTAAAMGFTSIYSKQGPPQSSLAAPTFGSTITFVTSPTIPTVDPRAPFSGQSSFTHTFGIPPGVPTHASTFTPTFSTPGPDTLLGSPPNVRNTNMSCVCFSSLYSSYFWR